MLVLSKLNFRKKKVAIKFHQLTEVKIKSFVPRCDETFAKNGSDSKYCWMALIPDSGNRGKCANRKRFVCSARSDSPVAIRDALSCRFVTGASIPCCCWRCSSCAIYDRCVNACWSKDSSKFSLSLWPKAYSSAELFHSTNVLRLGIGSGPSISRRFLSSRIVGDTHRLTDRLGTTRGRSMDLQDFRLCKWKH